MLNNSSLFNFENSKSYTKCQFYQKYKLFCPRKLEAKEYQAVWNTIVDDEGKVSLEKILNKTAHSAALSEVRNKEKTYSDKIIQSHGGSGGKRKLSEEDYTQPMKKSQKVSFFGS